MKIAFITNEAYPSGMATTNRIHSLAKGLSELKNEVVVFCVKPSEQKENIINKERKGIKDGVHFCYTTKSVVWPNSKFKKLYYLVFGFLKFFPVFNNYNKLSKFDFVITTTSGLFSNFLYTRYLKFKKIKFLNALDEYPHVVRNKNEYPQWFSRFYLKHFYKFFNGLIIMTTPLIKYYRLLSNAPIKHIPMTVETERFMNVQTDRPIKEPYIAYCGNIGQSEKDGVPNLIKAFGIVKRTLDVSNLKLIIIGGTKPSDFEKVLGQLKKYTDEEGVQNDTIFTGKINRSGMAQYLCNAELLALARPSSIQSQGGFPTKLGEYLATGVPTVVTSVGEIPEYLHDGKNAFISVPDSPKEFANKIIQALNNIKTAKEVGNNGQVLALDVFNYQVQSSNLNVFLKKLL